MMSQSHRIEGKATDEVLQELLSRELQVFNCQDILHAQQPTQHTKGKRIRFPLKQNVLVSVSNTEHKHNFVYLQETPQGTLNGKMTPMGHLTTGFCSVPKKSMEALSCDNVCYTFTVY